MRKRLWPIEGVGSASSSLEVKVNHYTRFIYLHQRKLKVVSYTLATGLIANFNNTLLNQAIKPRKKGFAISMLSIRTQTLNLISNGHCRDLSKR